MSPNICLGRSATIRDNAQPDIQPRHRPGPEMPCSPDGYLTRPFRHAWRSNRVCESRLLKFRDAGAGKESSPAARYKVTPNSHPQYHYPGNWLGGERQKMEKWKVVA